MGWFSWLSKGDKPGNAAGSPATSVESSGLATPERPDIKKPKLLLDDLPPKFEDDAVLAAEHRNQARPSLKKAWETVQWDDFKRVNSIPCFRQGIVTGAGVGAVVFAVLVSTRSSVSRGLNWGMGGFLLGSTVAWEQCRYRIRQSRKNAEIAKRLVRDKEHNPSAISGPSLENNSSKERTN
jgi:cytochrome c oxidase assembly protein subunit 20